MHLFKFFVDESGWLSMQYKLSPINSLWSPKDGLMIWLRKVDAAGHLKLLVGIPNLIPFCPIWGNDELRAIEKERFISIDISKYVDSSKLGMLKDDSYVRLMGLYVNY